MYYAPKLILCFISDNKLCKPPFFSSSIKETFLLKTSWSSLELLIVFYIESFNSLFCFGVCCCSKFTSIRVVASMFVFQFYNIFLLVQIWFSFAMSVQYPIFLYYASWVLNWVNLFKLTNRQMCSGLLTVILIIIISELILVPWYHPALF